MKKQADANHYTVEINQKVYGFHCDDGEEHVKIIREKLDYYISKVSPRTHEHFFSDAAREEMKRLKQEEIITERLTPLLKELDRVLKPSN